MIPKKKREYHRAASGSYRERMKKEGYNYHCFWIHKDDLDAVKKFVDLKGLERSIEIAKKGDKK